MTTFDDLPLFRNTDPEGSVNGAKHITPKRGSQAMRLLAVYKELDYAEGLTDEMAAQAANLLHGWKRCSDLRKLGYVAATGEQVPTSSGVLAMVCRITPAGLEALK